MQKTRLGSFYAIEAPMVSVESYSEIIWKSNDTCGSPVIAPQKHIEIQTNPPLSKQSR